MSYSREIMDSNSETGKPAEAGLDKTLEQQREYGELYDQIRTGVTTRETFIEAMLNRDRQHELAMKRMVEESGHDPKFSKIFHYPGFIDAVDGAIREGLRDVKENKIPDLKGSWVLLDVDNFKVTNDELGYLGADQVLRELIDICKSSLRSADIVGRFGGEEFLIYLPDTDLAGGVIATEKIMNSFKIKFDGKYSFSAGIQTIPTEGIDLERLTKDEEYRVDLMAALMEDAGRALKKGVKFSEKGKIATVTENDEVMVVSSCPDPSNPGKIIYELRKPDIPPPDLSTPARFEQWLERVPTDRTKQQYREMVQLWKDQGLSDETIAENLWTDLKDILRSQN